MTGLLAGHVLLLKETPAEKVNYLMTAGVISAMAGYFWGRIFPVNENLWTSSFVLVTSGFAALLFGTAYFLVDIKGHTRLVRPGIVFGANAITVFFLADVWALFFYEWKPAGHSLNERAVEWMTGAGASAELASLLYALFFVCVNFVPAWLLFRKKIFIRL
jgi:predicted acyltransferase